MKPRSILDTPTNVCTFICGCMTLALLLLSQNTWAQPQQAASVFAFGLGVIPSDEGYKAQGLKATVIPALRIQTPRFAWRGTSAEWTVTEPGLQDFSVNLRADLLMQGYKASDGVIFSGMEKRSPSLLVGLGAKYLSPIGLIWLESGVDATGNSKGMRSELGLGWRVNTHTALGKWTLSPYLSAQLNNAKLANYYFGVSSSEATASRPAYQATSTTNINLGVSASTDLSANMSLLLSARYRYYGASIRKSPLLDSAGSVSGIASILYRF